MPEWVSGIVQLLSLHVGRLRAESQNGEQTTSTRICCVPKGEKNNSLAFSKEVRPSLLWLLRRQSWSGVCWKLLVELWCLAKPDSFQAKGYAGWWKRWTKAALAVSAVVSCLAIIPLPLPFGVGMSVVSRGSGWSSCSHLYPVSTFGRALYAASTPCVFGRPRLMCLKAVATKWYRAHISCQVEWTPCFQFNSRE